MSVIALSEASRWYGSFIALNGVTLELGRGVFGLLGPNGAGKTTLLRLVTGQVRPTTGTVTVHGAPAWDNVEVRSRIGYCPEHDRFYEDMTGLEFVTLMTRLHGFSAVEASARAEKALIDARLPPDEGSATKPIADYSKGMRQKVKIAQALAHDPDVLILDEPLTGCDPLSRHHISALCKELGAQGRTVVLSSHVLHEVEGVTREFVLIDRGRLLAEGNVQKIRALIDEHPHRIEVHCSAPRRLAALLAAEPHVSGLELPAGDEALVVETTSPDACYAAIPRTALEAGIRVRKLTSPDNNLEAVFRYLTKT